MCCTDIQCSVQDIPDQPDWPDPGRQTRLRQVGMTRHCLTDHNIGFHYRKRARHAHSGQSDTLTVHEWWWTPLNRHLIILPNCVKVLAWCVVCDRWKHWQPLTYDRQTSLHFPLQTKAAVRKQLQNVIKAAVIFIRKYKSCMFCLFLLQCAVEGMWSGER